MKSFSMFVLIVLAFAAKASAHANLDHAEPKVGATVAKSPAAVKIWFSEDIEPEFSSVEVADSSGKQVDKKDAHVAPGDEKLLIVSIPSLPAGMYTVTWKVVATDTHHTHGDFTFTIAPRS